MEEREAGNAKGKYAFEEGDGMCRYELGESD